MPRIYRSLVWVGALIASACGGDSTGSSTGFTVSADTAAASTLGRSVTFHVLLTSQGSAGAVTLNVTGAPGTWSVTPSAATLPQNGQVTVDVVVAIPSNGDAAPTGQSLTVEATVGTVSHTASTRVTVADQYIIPLLLGASGAGGHWGALATTTITLRVGTVLTIRNDDTTAHLIHFDGDIPGVDHQDTGGGGILSGGTYSQTVAGSGSDAAYCHSDILPTDYITIVVP